MIRQFSWEKFADMPIVAIARNISANELKSILPMFCSSGLSTIEITMNSLKSEDLIRSVVDEYGEDINVGAGTVCTMKDLEKALTAGAQFIVTPIVDVEVIKACLSESIPVFSGAFTTTEIFKAWSAGADIVKVFPATALGPDYIKEVKAPLNQVKLMPTGGVNKDNCIAFLKAGAEGLGMGGQLFDNACIKEENWDGLMQHFGNIVKIVSAYKMGQD